MAPEYGRRRVLLSGIGGFASALAGCTERTPVRTDGGTTTREPRKIAHRGCADQYPENTVLAVEKSAPHVDMVEIDVQRCRSGEIVVFHDDRLDRLTDASGSVRTTDWETLKDLTILDSDQTIPLLSEILDAVPADTGVNIELKREGLAEDVLDTTANVENDVLYSSFSAKAIREVREHDDDAALAYVVDDSPDISLSIAADIGCVAVHPGKDLVFESNIVTAAQDEEFEVNVWTVDTEETAQRLTDAGADGLFLDRWDIL